MKISELVTKLEELKAKYGDVTVVHQDSYEQTYYSIKHVWPIGRELIGPGPKCKTESVTQVELA